MGIEFELKYRTTPETNRTLEQAVTGQVRHFDMETIYYDTGNGDLSARHWTLRRRMENENSICTLKFPADGQGRGEVEISCESIEKAIPELCKLSGLEELPFLCQEGVLPVCGAKFHRIAKTFLFEDSTIELALDEGVLIGGGRELPLCEAELELKEGTPDAVIRYGRLLTALYGLTPEKKSKFKRALELAKGE